MGSMKRISSMLAVSVACGVLSFGSAALAQSALSTEQATLRFHEAEALERKHDLRASLDAYTEAGEAGNPLAQKKLGDLYGAGNAAVLRDYEASLKWYQKA